MPMPGSRSMSISKPIRWRRIVKSRKRKNETLADYRSLFLTGCALGPDYMPVKWDFVSGMEGKIYRATLADNPKTEIDKEWWKNFDDPALNDLITKALANNLDVKIALAHIKEARAERLGVIAGQLPEVDATANAGRTKNSANTFSLGGGKPFNAFNAGFDASWEADIFGGRRAIEAANATLEAAQESAHDVEVTLLGDVASQYIAVRNYQNQIKVAEENLAAQHDTLELTAVAQSGWAGQQYRCHAGASACADDRIRYSGLARIHAPVAAFAGNTAGRTARRAGKSCGGNAASAGISA